MDHKQEPWSYAKPKESNGYWDVYSDTPDSGYICTCFYRDQEANARRIVAAVNACAGIPTEALEAGGVSDLVKSCKALLEACYAADVDGELDYRIDGSLMDAAGTALAKAEARS